VKLGDVMRKERERCGLSAVQVASTLNLDIGEHADIENGKSAAEQWGPIIAAIAMKFRVPIARLLSVNGRSDWFGKNTVARLLEQHRRLADASRDAVAGEIGIDAGQYAAAEDGRVRSMISPVGF
jgi:transcriptional regulator with XRE-family HTH domain